MYQSEKYNDSRPNVGVTIVPFIYEDDTIKTKVYKRSADAEVFANQYCLPNAIFDTTKFKTLEETAHFALSQKISSAINLKHLEQFHTFSGEHIDPDRINTVNSAYISLTHKSEIFDLGDPKFESEWLPVTDCLKLDLAFNHNEVLALAYQRLKSKAEYTALTAHLLGYSFTITQFRTLIEHLIDEPLDNSRFRDRIKKSDVLIALVDEFQKSAGRSAQLFRLNEDYKDYFYPKSLTKPTNTKKPR